MSYNHSNNKGQVTTNHAVPIQVASLEAGESYLRSFNMHPAQLTRAGGLLFKITAYHLDGTKCLLHLTDRRIIIEPTKTNALQDAIQGIIRRRVNMPSLAAAQWPQIFLKTTDDWGYWSIPYDSVAAIDSFRQGIGTFARIRLKGHPHESDIIFTTQSGVLITTKDFIQAINGLWQRQ